MGYIICHASHTIESKLHYIFILTNKKNTWAYFMPRKCNDMSE